MPSLEIHPLSDLRDEAASLLAERYGRQRSAEPFLPEPGDLPAELPVCDGLVATRGGRAVAYLAGQVTEGIATVGFAGSAASEPEALRDLFAAQAPIWEVNRFAIAVPVSEPESVDAWFRLAFGLQFVWSVRAAEPVEPVDAGVVIRPSAPDHLDHWERFDELLWQTQAATPSFSGRTIPARAEFREEWSDLWDDPETYWPFVAERDGEIVGEALIYRRPFGGLRVPIDNVDLAHAATLPEVRGSGVGLALTAHIINWAHEQGYASITTDWRVVSLLASRFWPKRGFRPQYLRLYRAVP
jgi:GNAT superfamily N-acetyltransferase